MIYVLLGVILIILICVLFLLYEIQMELIPIEVRTDITKDIVTNWAIYYVCKEACNGNNVPFDFIFPNDREIIEKEMKQDKCHIDNKKE